MKIDELLEMSRRMTQRMDSLRREQAATVERISAGVNSLRGVVDAASEAIKV